MNHGAAKERRAARREPLPADDQPAGLLLEAGQGALGVEAWHLLFGGRPRGLRVFQPRLGIWARTPRLRRRGRRSLASSPLSVARTWSRLRGRPRWPGRRWRASSRGMTWARSSPWAGVVRVDSGMPAPSVRRWMRRPWPFRPGATPSPPPVPGGKGAIDGAILPLDHPTSLGQPE
jgi:hypothetical protein